MLLAFRLLLLLLPVLLVILWLKKNSESETAERDTRRLTVALWIGIALLAGFGAGLYLSDSGRGGPNEVYVPPRVEDGKVIPGEFQDQKQDKETDEQSGGSSGG